MEQLKLASDPNERTDFSNFRSLLWRSMAQFPDRVEPRSRELSPLLLRFIRSVVVVVGGSSSSEWIDLSSQGANIQS